MGKIHFLFATALLSASCDSLWNPFQGPNPAYCEPGSAGCPDPGPDGGLGDAAAESDGSMSGDGSTADGAMPPDLGCNPGPASPWVGDPAPPGSGGVALTGVAGNGAGDLWVVGNPPYAAHRATGWNTLTVSALINTFGRMVYAPKQTEGMAIATSNSGGEIVYLTTSSAFFHDLVTSAPETLGGLWVSPAPESIAYTVGSSGSFQSYANGVLWQNTGVSGYPKQNAISGTGTSSSTTIWGASASDMLFSSYSAASNSWRMLSSGANSFNAVFANGNSGVTLVGKLGVIMTAPATVPPLGPLTSAPSPVTATLTDVAGTADGKHLFAVGAGGTLLHWESTCRRWTQEASPTTQDLSALWVSDAERTVWAVGNAGNLIHRAIP